jgi:hypothetical protein
LEMASEHQRYGELIRQRDCELGYANNLLRVKDEEITALRSETMQLRMQPPVVMAGASEYFTTSAAPMEYVMAPTTSYSTTEYVTTDYSPMEYVVAPSSPVISPVIATPPPYASMMETVIAPSYVAPTVYAAPAFDTMYSASTMPSTFMSTPMVETFYSTVSTVPTIPMATAMATTTSTGMGPNQHRSGRLKVLVTEGTDFARKHKHPYVLLTVGSHTTHTHATKRDRQRHVSWNEMAEFEVQDANSEILRVSIAEKHRLRHDEKFAASRPIPLAQLPYNIPRSFTADTGLGRVNLQLEFLPPAGQNPASQSSFGLPPMNSSSNSSFVNPYNSTNSNQYTSSNNNQYISSNNQYSSSNDNQYSSSQFSNQFSQNAGQYGNSGQMGYTTTANNSRYTTL